LNSSVNYFRRQKSKFHNRPSCISNLHLFGFSTNQQLN